jgi:hypothetical protein
LNHFLGFEAGMAKPDGFKAVVTDTTSPLLHNRR